MTIKGFRKRLPKNGLQKLGAVIGILMLVFGWAQWDIICMGPVWSSGWQSPEYPKPFAVHRWNFGFGWTDVGTSYDIMQWLTLLGPATAFLSLWFWETDVEIVEPTP
jgi:hypothetical protein